MVMTEIQFLVDIILNHKLQPEVRDKFVARIGEVEATLTKPQRITSGAVLSMQAPSTQKILEEMSQEPIINSPVAAQALQARQQAIAQATSGTPEKGRTSPRKF